MGATRLVSAAASLIVVGLLCAPTSAQRGAPPPAPQQPAIFRTATQFVSLDVVVTGDDNKPVEGLTKDDFIITENKREQKITDFSYVAVPIVVRPVNLDAPPPPASDIASNARSAASSRALVIVIDDLAIKPDMLVPLKRALTEFLSKLSSDDQVAIVYVSRSDLSRDFTNDLGPLIEAANGRRKALGLSPMSRDPERELLITMTNVMETLQAARQSRHAIILVSSRGCSPGPNAECNDLIEKSRRTGVPIYGLDPRLFVEDNALSTSTLKGLSASTGASAFVGQSDIPTAVDGILNQNGHYYLLGYYPDPVSTDGKFHKIEVEIRRPGMHIQTREGYTAPKPNPTASTPKREMTADLGAGLDDPGLPIRVFAAPIGPGAKGTRTAITVELTYPFPTTDSRALNDEVRFGAMALNPDAKIKSSLQRPMTFTGTWTPVANGRIVLNEVMELPTEVLTLRVGVASRALGKTGTTHLRVDVPDFTDNDLVASPIVLGGPEGALDAAVGLDYLRGLIPFQPIVSRTFTASDTLRAFVRASWKSSETSAVATVRLTGPKSVLPKVIDLRGTARKDGHVDVTLDAPVSLKDLPPGEYLLSVDLSVPKKHTLNRALSFTIR